MLLPGVVAARAMMERSPETQLLAKLDKPSLVKWTPSLQSTSLSLVSLTVILSVGFPYTIGQLSTTLVFLIETHLPSLSKHSVRQSVQTGFLRGNRGRTGSDSSLLPHNTERKGTWVRGGDHDAWGIFFGNQ
jgi:hypothetical protein